MNETMPGETNRFVLEQINADGKVIFRSHNEWFGSTNEVANLISLDLFNAARERAEAWNAAKYPTTK